MANTKILPWQVNTSRREVVATAGDALFRLEHYLDDGDGERILIVPPIINQPWILDLRPEVSVIQRFCEQGFDVYMIRWHWGRQGDIGFYEMSVFVQQVLEKIGGASLFGYCTGGTIALIYAACFSGLANSLTLLATPVDFSKNDPRILWGRYFEPAAFRSIFRDVPGGVINSLGASLLYYYFPQFLPYREFVDEITSEEVLVDYLRRLRWIIDTPPIPGKAYEEFIRSCYKDNALIQNKMRVDGRLVDLRQINVPVLNIMAQFDHLVPVESVRPLGDGVSSLKYEEIIFPSTHVGLSVSRKAHKHLWPRVTRWIEKNRLVCECPGSD